MKGLFIFLGIIFVVGYACSGGSSTDSGGDSWGAEDTCKDWVTDELRAPSTADFNDVSSESTGNDSWTVSGTVDAQNGFGAQIRADWTCDIRLDSDDFYRGNAYVLN